jgi:hypothetical protein
MASDALRRPQADKVRAGVILSSAALALVCSCGSTQVAANDAPAIPGIGAPPAASVGVRHTLRGPQLQALAGQRLLDKHVSRLLGPTLQRVIGTRYDGFKASLIDEKPLRVEGTSLVGEGIVPNTLGYRGAFFVFGSRGDVLAVIKSGRHGTTIERFGSLEVLKDPALLHAYQEFIGIDE